MTHTHFRDIREYQCNGNLGFWKVFVNRVDLIVQIAAGTAEFRKPILFTYFHDVIFSSFQKLFILIFFVISFQTLMAQYPEIHGQKDRNFGAAIGVIMPRNPPLKLINNPFYGGQPETGSALFGGKKRGKKFLEGLSGQIHSPCRV